MPLSTYALVSLAEAKDVLGTPGGGKDGFLERAINIASSTIEQYLDRQIVSRGTLTEYHTMQSAMGCELYATTLRTLQRPIISVTSVNEERAWPHTYGASSLLVLGTDYEIVGQLGLNANMIRRLLGAGPYPWYTDSRAIRLIYTAGYATTAVVPDHIKGVVFRLLGVMNRENERKSDGMLSQSDSMGNFTRFGPARLTDDMKADLDVERRMEVSSTGEAA